MMKSLCLVLLALASVRCAQQVYSVKQELLQENLRKKCESKIKSGAQYRIWKDTSFAIQEKSGAFFYTQENKISSWKATQFGYSALNVELLQKNNGTMKVHMKDVYLKVESNYETTVYVDWLKNSTGKVTFQITSDMDFDFSVALDSRGKAKATAQSVQGLRIQEDSVNATIANAPEELAESLAALFARRGGPVLMSVRDLVQNYLDQALDEALTNVKKSTDYINNQYRYKMINTPSSMGIYQDGQLSVYLSVDVYDYSSKISSSASNVTHQAMGNSSSSLLEFEVDKSLLQLGLQTYMNSYSTSTKKFNNKELGKIFKNYYGDNSYDALNQVFHMDEKDYLKKSNQYELGVSLKKDSAEVHPKNSSVAFQVEVGLYRPYGYNLYHPRKFVVDCSATLAPFVDGSVLKASLSKVWATDIRLYGDSNKQISLTASEQKQYMTFAALFFQLKRKTLKEMASQIKFDLSQWDPLDSLHASFSDKTYKLTMHENSVNLDVQSESVPVSKPSAQLFTIYPYYQDSLSFYERVANTLQDGLNQQDYTVVAQVDAQTPNFYWVRPNESLAKMTSFQNSQVTLYKKK